MTSEDLIESSERLSSIFPHKSGEVLHAYNLAISRKYDANEVAKFRIKQIVQLARYGRQSMLQWDDVDLIDFLAYHEALVDAYNQEQASLESEDE
jgi:hypothetical protein